LESLKTTLDLASPPRVVVGDPESCRGCGGCELICSLSHEGECNPSVSRISVKKDFFQIEFIPGTCRQCPDHPCMDACPEEAIHIDALTAAKVIEESKCIGCGLCASACPFNQEGRTILFHQAKKVYVKCDLCGGKPLCVEYCPREALRYVRWNPRLWEREEGSL